MFSCDPGSVDPERMKSSRSFHCNHRIPVVVGFYMFYIISPHRYQQYVLSVWIFHSDIVDFIHFGDDHKSWFDSLQRHRNVDPKWSIKCVKDCFAFSQPVSTALSQILLEISRDRRSTNCEMRVTSMVQATTWWRLLLGAMGLGWDRMIGSVWHVQ